MAEITVLGCGRVGRAIALDLSTKHRVRAVDKDRALLDSLPVANIEPCLFDLSRENELQEAISGADLVVNAVPGFMGFSTLRQVIEAGKDTVDIAFSPENTGDLDELARSRKVTAVVDCGVAPGMSNVIIGYHAGKMKVQAAECLVGGLPQVRSWPFQYKAPFSPIDVIEEYVRPARMRENGRIIIKPALSDAELVELPEIGTLEAFNTDGLRSLLETTDIPDLKEKTLRYPGHIEYIRVLRHIGLFSDREITVKGTLIRPVDLTARLLFPLWKPAKNEPEFTVMRLRITGREKNSVVIHEYYLLDKYDSVSGISSMARTTGYACNSAVELILNGNFNRRGVSPPEYLGTTPGCLEKMLAYQAERNIHYLHEISELANE